MGLFISLVAGTLAASAAARPPENTFMNAVSKGFADTFADPSIIKAKDGYWYAYGTSDPLTEDEGDYHLLPTARSKDLVHWNYTGDVFDESNQPEWMDEPEICAPDIRCLDGTYYLYYVVTETTVTDEGFDNAIGVATAPTPTGPWTDSGAPLVEPAAASRATPVTGCGPSTPVRSRPRTAPVTSTTAPITEACSSPGCRATR